MTSQVYVYTVNKFKYRAPILFVMNFLWGRLSVLQVAALIRNNFLKIEMG
jgi:hypothetical protein